MITIHRTIISIPINVYTELNSPASVCLMYHNYDMLLIIGKCRMFDIRQTRACLVLGNHNYKAILIGKFNYTIVPFPFVHLKIIECLSTSFKEITKAS